MATSIKTAQKGLSCAKSVIKLNKDIMKIHNIRIKDKLHNLKKLKLSMKNSNMQRALTTSTLRRRGILSTSVSLSVIKVL